MFITSTFLDMQGERDFLRTVVFPDLEEKLKARRRHLEWIDLRVGVKGAAEASEEARELQVLKVCLAEVKRSRPFLIALIGDRYGWVPPEERIKAAAEEEGFTAEVAGRSVTDLEIDFGVLSDPEQPKRSYFYFREPLAHAAMGDRAADYSEEFDVKDPEAHARAKKLEALKERIKARFPDRVRAYRAHWDGEGVTGFDRLRELVTADLWRELDAETADALDQGEVPWRQAERAAMADFAEDRARDFVGRKDVLRRIARFAASKPGEGPWGLCVTGAAGAGKSALWGMLQARLPQAKFALVLGHAAGASQRASSVDAMLRRWIEELAADLGVPSELAEDAKDEDVEAAFASLLGRVAQKRRVLILVDALDQFEQTTRALNLTWLPRLWPDNARLIATAIPGEASQTPLQRPGVEEAPLPPLAASEARDIIAGVCRRYHRTFETPVIDALAAKQGESGLACGNPLWLTMAVEELNLLDADDFARARRDYGRLPPAAALCALMCDIVGEMPADVPGLYARSFDRAAALFGAPLTQAFLGMIAASRGGWRESDFREVLPKLSGEPWDELRFAQLRRLFRGQMRQRGALGQWDFAHGQMRPAAKTWLARRKAPPEPAIHAAIADHLLALPADDPLHVGETMAHLMAERNAPARAREYYGSESLSDAETDGAARVLADLVLTARAGDRLAALGQVLRLVDGTGAIAANVAQRLLFDFDAMIDQRVELNIQAVLYDGVKAAFGRLLVADPGNAFWQHELSVSYSKIGDVQRAQGHLPEALKSFRDGLAIAERMAKGDPGNAGWQSDLSVSYGRIGEVLVQQGNLPEALENCRDGLGIADRLTKADAGNANWQHGLSVSYDRIGEVLVAQGHLPEALKSFRDSLAIRDRLAKADPGNAGWQHDLSVSYDRVGDVLVALGNLPEALKSFRDSFAIMDRLAKADPSNANWQHGLSVSLNNIGDVLVAQGNLPEALKNFRDSFAIMDRLAKADAGNAGWQHDLSASYMRIGNVLFAQGNLPEALKSFRDSFAIMDRLAKAEAGNAGW
ncbi:MAG: tetratricopeptide repeat protein, partial [Roseiarcus sp.]